MARPLGRLALSSPIEPGFKGALDARERIPLLSDLINIDTWKDSTGFPNIEIGQYTFCVENKTGYVLIGDDVTDINNWRVVTPIDSEDSYPIIAVNGSNLFNNLEDTNSGQLNAYFDFLEIEEIFAAENRLKFRNGFLLTINDGFDDSKSYPTNVVLDENTGNITYYKFTVTTKKYISEIIVYSDYTYYKSTTSLENKDYDFRASDYVTNKTNATAGLQALFDAVAKSELQMPNVLIEAGEYIVDGLYTINKSINLDANGATINCSNYSSVINLNDACIRFTGQYSTIYNMFETIDDVIPFKKGIRTYNILNNNYDVKPGDLFRVTDLDNTFNYEYGNGELLEVESVSDSQITFSESFHYDMDKANVVVQMLTPIKVNIKGLNVVGKERISDDYDLEHDLIPISFWFVKDSIVENVTATNCSYTNIEVKSCYKVDFNNCKVDYKSAFLVGVNYGVAIYGCYYTNVNGGFYKSSRHGLSVSGGDGTGISRYINVSKVTISSYRTDNICAADTHRCIDFVNFIECTISGGIDIYGTNNKIIGCTIIGSNFNVRGVQILGSHPNSTLIIDNNYISSNNNETFQYLKNENDVDLRYSKIIISNNFIDSSFQRAIALHDDYNNQMPFVSIISNIIKSNVNNNLSENSCGGVNIIGNNGFSIRHNTFINGGIYVSLLSNHANFGDINIDNNTFEDQQLSAIYMVLNETELVDTNEISITGHNNTFKNCISNAIYCNNNSNVDVEFTNTTAINCGSDDLAYIDRFYIALLGSKGIILKGLKINHTKESNSIRRIYCATTTPCYSENIINKGTLLSDTLENGGSLIDISNRTDIIPKSGTYKFADGIPQWWDATKDAWVNANGGII